MPWDGGAAVAAGAVATLVMTAMLYMGFFMMPRQMPMNLLYMLGTMMTTRTGPAYMAGAMAHAMMGIVFALAHTGIFRAFDVDSDFAAWGLLFGFVHWLIVGMGMGMIGMMHPLMKRGQMTAPGPFLTNFPMMTVMGFLMLHLVYGVLVGVLYDAWA
ncbi:MAG: hypothetical protein V3V35_10455 [Dehalococcoidia bacterium]